MAPLSEADLARYREKLEARRRELLEEIRTELHRTEEESYVELAGRVHDEGEEAVADLLADMNLDFIARQIEELREVEDALGRIERGEYGVCIDCGGEIERERLDAQPTALRCIECQAAWERTHATGPGHPTSL